MGYTAFDRFVALCRFRAALPHVRPGAWACDIGCGIDARFLEWAGDRIGFGVGLDRQGNHCNRRARIVRADITLRLPLRSSCFDHALMLAVLEHLPQPMPVLRGTFRILRPGGSLILTWPDAAVDPILRGLRRLRFVSDEMESEDHQLRLSLGTLLEMLREIGFERFTHRRFELGLNNLLIAYKSGCISPPLRRMRTHG